MNQIIIEKHNPNWANEFEEEKGKLQRVFNGKTTIIEHIGSTSVKNLAAKPIIDMMIGIHDFDQVTTFVSSIQQLGFDYIEDYEAVMPKRRFFIKQKNGKRTHHIHLVKLYSEFWHRHLNFRNHLRNNVEDKEQYQKLKIALSRIAWNERDEYTEAKSAFIRNIERKYNHTK
jgi:GrpB-like predicted nucleotidyltransferase (UPF0157 family)